MSVNKTVTLEAKTKGFQQTEKEVEELNQDLGKTAEAVDEVNKSFEKGATFAERYGEELQPLTTRMGEAEDRLYELALAGDTTSKEYQELLTSVGNYRKTQIQTDLAVDAAATTLSQKLGGALTGATSGFAAVQGVMGLVGSESETLEKTLLKVQSALALQQGVQGVLDYSKSIGLASKATKAFNLIVKANPLALFATVIASVVAGVLLFTDTLQPAIDGLKRLTDFVGLTNFEETKLAEERKTRHEQQVKAQQDEIDLLKQKRKLEKEDFERNIAFLESQGKSTLRLRKARVLDQIAEKERIAELFKGTFIEKKAQRDLIELKTQLNNINKEIRAENKAASVEKKKQDDDEIARQKELARLQQEAMEKEIDEEVELQRQLDQIKRENEDRFRTEEENELLLVEEKYDTLKAMAQGNAEALKQIEIARLNELNDIRNKFTQEEVKTLTEREEFEALSADRKRELAVNAASDTFSTLANLAELFAGESKKQQKRAFKVQKAANIAQATVDTFSSAIAAYKSQASIPVVGPVLGGIAAAAAVSAGLLNIKKISQQRFESGGGTDGGGADFAPSGGGAQAPQFNVVGDSGVNQLAQLQQQPTQAFVVSGEVTTAQALDRNRVQNATL